MPEVPTSPCCVDQRARHDVSQEENKDKSINAKNDSKLGCLERLLAESRAAEPDLDKYKTEAQRQPTYWTRQCSQDGRPLKAWNSAESTSAKDDGGFGSFERLLGKSRAAEPDLDKHETVANRLATHPASPSIQVEGSLRDRTSAESTSAKEYIEVEYDEFLQAAILAVYKVGMEEYDVLPLAPTLVYVQDELLLKGGTCAESFPYPVKNAFGDKTLTKDFDRLIGDDDLRLLQPSVTPGDSYQAEAGDVQFTLSEERFPQTETGYCVVISNEDIYSPEMPDDTSLLAFLTDPGDIESALSEERFPQTETGPGNSVVISSEDVHQPEKPANTSLLAFLTKISTRQLVATHSPRGYVDTAALGEMLEGLQQPGLGKTALALQAMGRLAASHHLQPLHLDSPVQWRWIPRETEPDTTQAQQQQEQQRPLLTGAEFALHLAQEVDVEIDEVLPTAVVDLHPNLAISIRGDVRHRRLASTPVVPRQDEAGIWEAAAAAAAEAAVERGGVGEGAEDEGGQRETAKSWEKSKRKFRGSGEVHTTEEEGGKTLGGREGGRERREEEGGSVAGGGEGRGEEGEEWRGKGEVGIKVGRVGVEGGQGKIHEKSGIENRGEGVEGTDREGGAIDGGEAGRGGGEAGEGRGGGGGRLDEGGGGVERSKVGGTDHDGKGGGGAKGGGERGGGGGKGRKEEFAKAGEWKKAKSTSGGEGRGGAAEGRGGAAEGAERGGGNGGERTERIGEGKGGGHFGERAERGGGNEEKGAGGEGRGRGRKRIQDRAQKAREGSGRGVEVRGTAGNGEGRLSPGNTAAAEADTAAKSRQTAEKQKSHGKICQVDAHRGGDKRIRVTAAATPASEEGADKGKGGTICGESERAVFKEEDNNRREEKRIRRRHQDGEEGQGETECIKGGVDGKPTGGIGKVGKGVEDDQSESKKRRQGEETENKECRGGRIGMCGGRVMGKGGGEEIGEGGAEAGGGAVNGGGDTGLGGEKRDGGGGAGGRQGDGGKIGGQMKSSGGGGGGIEGEGEGGGIRGDVTVKSKGNEVSEADREGGAGAHGRAGQRAQGAGSERNAFPPGDVQDSAACLAGGAMDHRVPTPAEPRKTLQTVTQTESQSWSVQGRKLTRPDSARSDDTHSGRGKHENTWVAKIPLLLLFCMGLIGRLACVGAGPVPGSLHVEGWGRTLQGENYRLVCVVTPPQAAHTSPAFSWYKNGTLLYNQTGRVLNFSPLSKQEEGDYRCGLKAENMERDQLSGPFSLPVYVLEKISLVPEVEVEEGQTVILNCSVHSDPTAYLTWRLGGKTLRTVRSNSDSLVLHNASQYHGQVVECEAYNNGLVLGFLDAYSLIRKKGTYEVIPTPFLGWKGDTVLHHHFALECIVGEIPNRGVNVHLTYTWYKDDKVMEGQSDMILDFPSLRKEDSGLYTCTARNGKPRTTSLESKPMEVVVLIPPVVHIEPRPADNVITQAAEETLTLTCKVTEAFPGVAPDGYRWSHLPSPGGQVRPLEGRESTLTLGPLTREDSGQYICQAWNYEDFDGLLPPGNASVTVDVMYLGHITLTSDLEVNEGDQVTVTCSVDSNPAARLSWWVEGREVRHVTANVDHYVLEKAACSDSKNYTCRASIPGLPDPERLASTHVTVNCTQSKHGRMPGLDIFVVHGDRKAVKGQSHRLRCLSAAAPHLEKERACFWVKDDRVMENETAEHLVILIVTEEHHGVYQCGKEHSYSVLLSEPFELHVLDEQTPGFVQIGVPIIIIVLTVIAVAAAAIAVVLIKKRRRKTSRKRQRNKPILRK